MADYTGTPGDDIYVGTSSGDTITGEGGNDLLSGEGGSDQVDGGDGDDVVSGGASDDLLYGQAGNDRLNGGAGSDLMFGGPGDDIYNYVDFGDQVWEISFEGYDTIRTLAPTYALPSVDVEELVLLHTGDTFATGNALANVIRAFGGNDNINGANGDDEIYGGVGNDTLNGGNNNDRLYGQSGNDSLNGGAGFDFLDGGSGNDMLNGNADADVLNGGAGRDVLNGGDGSDVISGGNQRDVFTGGLGADVFQFEAGDFAGLGRSGADSITDFSHAQGDQIDLSSLNMSFIGAAAFSGTAGELRYFHMQGDTMVYGDTNGDGAADFSIHLVGIHNLVAGDFILTLGVASAEGQGPPKTETIPVSDGDSGVIADVACAAENQIYVEKGLWLF